MDLKKFINSLKNKKNSSNMINILIIFLVGVFLIITASTIKSPKKSTEISKSVENDANTKVEYYGEDELENKLKYILGRIDGVGRVEVMMYFDSGEEQIPAFNVTDSTNVTEEKDTEGGVRSTTQKNNGANLVITNNGSNTQPIILKKYKPHITGVIVVAEGADDKIIEYRITQAVIKLFNISSDKVNVYSMKK